MFFLDTNTCIYYLNGRSPSVRENLLRTPPVQIAIPVIVKAELLLGAFKSRRRQETLEKVETFLSPFEIIPFCDGTAYRYAGIRSALEIAGEVIGANDLCIAASALYHDAVLVSSNTREFGRVKGLSLLDWQEDPPGGISD